MMTRHRGHDGRVVAEACDSDWRAGHQNDERQCLGSLVVSREAVPHSVRNPARVVLHTQGFVDSKSSSNWEEVDIVSRGKGSVGENYEKCEGGEKTETNT